MGMKSLLGITSVLDYIDKDGNVIDKRGLRRYLESEILDESDMCTLVRRSPDARRIVREWSHASYREALIKRPNSPLTKWRKHQVENERAKGRDPFDSWYSMSVGDYSDNKGCNLIMRVLGSFRGTTP
jgi:hypothetical protein